MFGRSCSLFKVKRDNVISEIEKFPEWGSVPEKYKFAEGGKKVGDELGSVS